jgi:hypothetical protein
LEVFSPFSLRYFTPYHIKEPRFPAFAAQNFMTILTAFLILAGLLTLIVGSALIGEWLLERREKLKKALKNGF